jgi:signal recognition particle receptor subunit beta
VVFFNYTTMQITAKIVYYGPGLCGKTTNLQHIHQKTAPRSRGEMVSLETETDRTLFFDLLPLDVGIIGGMKVRLQLYTVPGQVFYNATRKLVLKGVDGVVFVADSQVAAHEPNLESLANLRANIAELGMQLEQIPLVFQYNKRDLRNIVPLEQLNETLNPSGYPSFEAAALHGIGVFETLKAISRLALISVRRRLAAEEPSKPGPAPRQAATPSAPLPQATSASRPAPSPTSAPEPLPMPTPVVEASLAGGANPLAALIAHTPTAEDVPVEFAEEDTDRHSVRPVPTKERLDIHDELAKLRTLATITPLPRARRPATSPKAEAQTVESRLQDVLGTVGDNPPRMELKRKASVVVPAAALRNSSVMKVQLAFDGDEQWAADAVTIRLTGNRKLERLHVSLDLELKTKSS